MDEPRRPPLSERRLTRAIRADLARAGNSCFSPHAGCDFVQLTELLGGGWDRDNSQLKPKSSRRSPTLKPDLRDSVVPAPAGEIAHTSGFGTHRIFTKNQYPQGMNYKTCLPKGSGTTSIDFGKRSDVFSEGANYLIVLRRSVPGSFSCNRAPTLRG